MAKWYGCPPPHADSTRRGGPPFAHCASLTGHKSATDAPYRNAVFRFPREQDITIWKRREIGKCRLLSDHVLFPVVPEKENELAVFDPCSERHAPFHGKRDVFAIAGFGFGLPQLVDEDRAFAAPCCRRLAVVAHHAPTIRRARVDLLGSVAEFFRGTEVMIRIRRNEVKIARSCEALYATSLERCHSPLEH